MNPKIASLVAMLTPGQQTLRLLPAGEFRAADGSGRPDDVPAWRLDAAIAAQLIAQHEARASLRVIDFEHQTLNSARNGQPAPAAGWIEALTWQAPSPDAPESGGLYARVRWTEKAAAMIAAGEYRYISPVFTYDASGRVLDILHAGLTNNPGLDGLTDLAALSALFFSASPTPPDQEIHPMKDLLKALGLPDAASETEAIAAVAALQAQAADHATQIATHLAALKAEPDPAQFAPAATVLALQGQVAALTRQIAAREVDALIEAGIADGRILPDLEPWARTLNALALKGFLDKAKPIAALGGMQTAGHAIGGGAAQSSSEAEVAVMKALGLTAAQFAAGKIKQEG